MKRKLCLVAIVALACIGALGASRAEGVIYYVNQAAAPGGDGLSWSHAFQHLQDALASTGPGDEVWVAQGVYHPDYPGPFGRPDRDATFALQIDVAIYGGFQSGDAWKDRDWVRKPTRLNGDLLENDREPNGSIEDNSLHVVSAINVQSTAVLDGFIVEAGYSGGVCPSHGAGMMISGWTWTEGPTVSNCLFRNNRTHLPGDR